MPLRLKHSLATSSLSERAYNLLKHEIITGNLAPGEKLNIYELAEILHISRTPLKEAINRLAHQGLITIRNRRATYVSTLEAEKTREVFDMRLMIELWGAERAVQENGSLDLDRMQEILKECDSLFSAKNRFNYERFNPIDMEFHLSIVKAARNTRLSNLYDSMSVHIQAMRVYWGHAFRPALDSHKEHIAIYKAFRSGNLDKVKRALRTHITRSRDDVIRVLGDSESHQKG